MSTLEIPASTKNKLSVSSFSNKLLGRNKIDGIDNHEWKIVVHDHKEYIKRNSHVYPTNVEEIHTYRYRPIQYLNEKHGITREYVWIVLFINDIVSAREFAGNIQYLYIPQIEIIDKLFNSYRSNKSYREKNKKPLSVIDNFGSI